MTEVVFAVLGALITIGLAYFIRGSRTGKLAPYAASRGWRFEASRPDLIRISPNSPFNIGMARMAQYAMTGVLFGHTFTTFQYDFTTSNGKETETESYHVTVIQLPVHTPYLWVRPEGAWARGRYASRDIQFESIEFNDAWYVVGENQKFAYDIVNPQLMTWLMQPQNRDISFRMDSGYIMVIRPGNLDVNRIDQDVWIMATILNEVRGFVWQNLGVHPTQIPGAGR